MSKKPQGEAPPEYKEPVSYLEPEVVFAATVMMAIFGWLAFLVLLLAGTLFFSSFMVPNPAIPGILWSFAGIGIISASCTAGIHHWLKTNQR